MLFKFRPNNVEHLNVVDTPPQALVARHELAEPGFRLCGMEEGNAYALGGVGRFRNYEYLGFNGQAFFAALVESAGYSEVVALDADRCKVDAINDIDCGARAFVVFVVYVHH